MKLILYITLSTHKSSHFSAAIRCKIPTAVGDYKLAGALIDVDTGTGRNYNVDTIPNVTVGVRCNDTFFLNYEEDFYKYDWTKPTSKRQVRTAFYVRSYERPANEKTTSKLRSYRKSRRSVTA
jgi:hypothetical protein